MRVKLVLIQWLRTETEAIQGIFYDSEPPKYPGDPIFSLPISYPAGTINKFQELILMETRGTYISELYSITAGFCVDINNIITDQHVDGNYSHIFFTDKMDEPLNKLNRFLVKENKDFLNFFHKLRNSMVHFSALHNKRNPLDYKLGMKIPQGTEQFELYREYKTTDQNLGQLIIFGLSDLHALYFKLKDIFQSEKFTKHPHFKL